MNARTNFSAIASAFADLAKREMAKTMRRHREADAARAIGTLGLDIGITDYRKAPARRMDARDWAVWIVRWDGTSWKRAKRLTARQNLSEAHEAIARHSKERGLSRVDR